MARFCFVHVADLHLDTPFACTRVDSPQIAETLREATFQAWDRVVSTCIERSAAFLVVAGDIFDASQKSLRAQLRFRDGLERLNHHSIPVFVTHGNHDPLDSVSASLTERYNSQLQTLRNEKGGLEIRLQELEKNQAEMLKNAKESERLETEKGLRDEMVALDGRIKELEAQAKVAESEKAVEVERVRLELEGKLGAEQTQNKDLTRRVDDYFGEITKLRERNTELEAEMAKVARVGKREEMDFANEALDELNRNRLRRRLSAQHLIF